MNRLVILFYSLVLFSMVSCERTSKSIADKEQGSDARLAMSDEVRHPSVHTTAGIAGIAEVLPIDASEVVLDGEALFVTHCSACHQVSGQGLPGVFPPLAGSSYVTSDNVERLAAIMIYGLSGPITVNGVEYNSVMAGLGPVLSDAELSAIAGYIRTSWGNDADEVSEEVFTVVREKHGSRGMFTIEELGAD
jgi:mono/diheme cytochrome c family protein